MILDEILAKTRLRVDELKKSAYLPDCGVLGALKPFKAVLQGTAIIAEVKQASPSNGIMDKSFDFLNIANDYKLGGAAALSVLCEPYYFKGNDLFVQKIHDKIDLPILYKDFIIDKIQIDRALHFGASAILLIVRALSKSELKELLDYAHGLGLDVLTEVHNRQEIEVALSVGADIIGVNTRDLDTLKIDFSSGIDLLNSLPKTVKRVLESGIETKEQMILAVESKADGVLIGSAFMRADDRRKAVEQFYELTCRRWRK